MTRFLLWIFGRIPIGWLQLVSNKWRFIAAGTGVAFACILVFVQLGMMGSFSEATRASYRMVTADILISSSDSNGLTDGSNVARRRMYQSLAIAGVREAMPLLVGKCFWQQTDGSKIELTAIGIDPNGRAFVGPVIEDFEAIRLTNHVLLDRRTRGLRPQQLANVTRENPLRIEVNNQQVTIAGTISLGGGFAGDGYMIMSDQTFLRLFPSRSSGAPNHILLNVESGENAREIAKRIQLSIASESIQVRTFADAIEGDVTYQTTRRPVGLIFGFGVAIGTLVGLVIVYQILSTDVADHLSEYATFKAMGYRQQFFRSIVMEEAVILAIVGFVPALLLSIGIYSVMAKATGLPIAMSLERATIVFLGSVFSCTVSGLLAMRKLALADPADLF